MPSRLISLFSDDDEPFYEAPPVNPKPRPELPIGNCEICGTPIFELVDSCMACDECYDRAQEGPYNAP